VWRNFPRLKEVKTMKVRIPAAKVAALTLLLIPFTLIGSGCHGGGSAVSNNGPAAPPTSDPGLPADATQKANNLGAVAKSSSAAEQAASEAFGKKISQMQQNSGGSN
jgi:hypothetical protein